MMTVQEAKKDTAQRLRNAGILFGKITARTWDFSGFGYDKAIFITIHGATLPHNWKKMFDDVPKPSNGGYCIEAAQ